MTLAVLASELRAGDLTPAEAVEASLGRIEALNPELNAFISVLDDEARARARELEGQTDSERGALWGVPLAVKDVIDVAGAKTTAASRLLVDNVAEKSAATVENLERAGAVIVGKLNTHEFAYGAMTTSTTFGPARNPWDTDRICGGSSGGSGCAAAAGLVAGTLGSDTAGSIRIPSAVCGVTGLRPSIGLVSNRGVVPVSWTFDTVGPIARTAEDCALILDALATKAAAAQSLSDGIKDTRIGVVRTLLDDGIDRSIAAAVEEAIEELAGLGAMRADIEVPLLREAGTIQQAIMLVEAAAVHMRWLRTRLSDYDPDVRARLLAGLLLPPTAYVTGKRARRLYLQGIKELFEHVDLLVAPTMPILPPRVGEQTVMVDGEEVQYRLSFIHYLSPWSCAGLPTASVPCGFVEGMPVGMTLVGRPFEDATVLRAAHAFQSVTNWHEQRPSVAAAV